MRQITQRATESFLNRRPMTLGNTSVKVGHLAYQDKTSPVNKSYVIGGGKNTSLSIVKDFQNTEAIDTPAGWVTPEEVEEFSKKTW